LEAAAVEWPEYVRISQGLSRCPVITALSPSCSVRKPDQPHRRISAGRCNYAIIPVRYPASRPNSIAMHHNSVSRRIVLKTNGHFIRPEST
jgi:hypothetical protein